MHKNLSLKYDFYLLLREYYSIYQKIFFSILSLTCIGDNPHNNSCTQYIDIMAKSKMDIYVEKSVNDSDDTVNYLDKLEDYLYQNDTDDYSDNDESTSVVSFNFLEWFFVDFVQLLFYQSQILSNILENMLEN